MTAKEELIDFLEWAIDDNIGVRLTLLKEKECSTEIHMLKIDAKGLYNTLQFVKNNYCDDLLYIPDGEICHNCILNWEIAEGE